MKIHTSSLLQLKRMDIFFFKILRLNLLEVESIDNSRFSEGSHIFINFDFLLMKLIVFSIL